MPNGERPLVFDTGRLKFHRSLFAAASTGEGPNPRSDAGPSPGRRTLNNLAWALAGLALGYLAQGLLEHDRLGEGLLLYAVAIPLFAVHLARPRYGTGQVLGDAPRQSPNDGLRGDADVPAPGIRSGLGWGIAAAGFILSLASLPLFVQELHTAAWFLYLTSLLLFAGGMWLVWPRTRGRASGSSTGPRPGGACPGRWAAHSGSRLFGAVLRALGRRRRAGPDRGGGQRHPYPQSPGVP